MKYTNMSSLDFKRYGREGASQNYFLLTLLSFFIFTNISHVSWIMLQILGILVSLGYLLQEFFSLKSLGDENEVELNFCKEIDCASISKLHANNFIESSMFQ